MNKNKSILIISHKLCYQVNNNSYQTFGGFPIQIKAISELFQTTNLLVPVCNNIIINNGSPLLGNNLNIIPLTKPIGSGWVRKLLLPIWFLNNFLTLLNQYKKADIIHAVVPGDIGFFGFLFAILFRKHLIVRHCGTWAHNKTISDFILYHLLLMFASKKIIILATGINSKPPALNNPYINWIFSSSISSIEIGKQSKTISKTSYFRLITISRLVKEKNIQETVKSMSQLVKEFPNVIFTIIGTGKFEKNLYDLIKELKLEKSIIMKGYLNHSAVLNDLKKSHLFVFPTKVREGCPKVIVESLSQGVPIICPPVSALEYFLDQGVGLALKECNSEEIYNQIKYIFSNPKLYEKLSHKALNISSTLTIEKWKQRFDALVP